MSTPKKFSHGECFLNWPTRPKVGKTSFQNSQREGFYFFWQDMNFFFGSVYFCRG